MPSLPCSLLNAPIIGDYKYGYADTLDPETQPRAAGYGARYGAASDRAAAVPAPALVGAALLAARMQPSAARGAGRGAAAADAEAGQRGGVQPWLHSGGLFVPIFLHSKSLEIGRPNKKPITAEAPLPSYMSLLIRSMGWGYRGKQS